VECCIENKAVGISSLEVVPLMLVLSLSKEQASMGATSNDRNPQPYSLATGTTEYPLFRWIISMSMILGIFS